MSFKNLVRENIKTTILFGMLFAGISQLVFILIASKALSTIDFARLINWTALSSVSMVAIGSPIVSLIALDINAKNQSISKSINFRLCQAGTITLAVGSITGVAWLFGEWGQLESSSFIGLVLLLVSGFVQSLSGIQRGIFLSQAKWGKTSLQVSIDGVIRVGVAVLVLLIDSAKFQLFVIGSTVAPLVAFLIMCFIDSNFMIYLPRYFKVDIHIREFFAFWSSSLSLHGMISFSPSFFAFRGASSSVIAAFGLALYIVRTPITASNSFTAPMFQRLTIEFGQKNFSKAKFHLLKILTCTLICYSMLAFPLWIFGPVFFLRFSDNALITDGRMILLFVLASLLFLIAIELGTYLIASQNFSAVSMAWLLGLVAFGTFGFWGVSLVHISIALVIGSLTTTILLSFGAITTSRKLMGIELVK